MALSRFLNNYVLIASIGTESTPLQTILHPQTILWLWFLTVMTCYDHMLTIGLEVWLIWCKPKRIIPLAVLVTRYLAVTISITRLVLLFKTTSFQVLLFLFTLPECLPLGSHACSLISCTYSGNQNAHKLGVLYVHYWALPVGVILTTYFVKYL
jgi:hypothetical protein